MQHYLNGPFDLSFDCLEKVVPAGRGGVFSLGYMEGNRFRVQRVGRVGSDLRGFLKGLIGSGNQFKYQLTRCEKEAFELECLLFHKFKPPSNFNHPVRPAESQWRCPHCLQSSL